jgi:hypothetical protein
MPNTDHIPIATVKETRYPLTAEQQNQTHIPVIHLIQWHEQRMQQLNNLKKRKQTPTKS